MLSNSTSTITMVMSNQEARLTKIRRLKESIRSTYPTEENKLSSTQLMRTVTELMFLTNRPTIQLTPTLKTITALQSTRPTTTITKRQHRTVPTLFGDRKKLMVEIE